MLGGADNSNGELPSYIIGANTFRCTRDLVSIQRHLKFPGNSLSG